MLLEIIEFLWVTFCSGFQIEGREHCRKMILVRLLILRTYFAVLGSLYFV